MNGQAQKFSYDVHTIAALEISLSPERFRTYVQLANGRRKVAVELCERNAYLSEALYGVIQPAEIALRNAIHRAISAGPLGPLWFEKIGLNEPQIDMVLKAKASLVKTNSTLTPGAIVAELRLGFWTALLSARYEKALWVPYLHKCFPHALAGKQTGGLRKLTRSEIHNRLETIRELRNRIAHHEPIIKFDLQERYDGLVSVLGWMCPITAEWVKATNCFPPRFAQTVVIPERFKTPQAPQPPTPGRPRF